MHFLLDVNEAAGRFDELIERMVRGEEFVICRGGIPIAELTAIPKAADADNGILVPGAWRAHSRPGWNDFQRRRSC